jgi:hypothetical protein
MTIIEAKKVSEMGTSYDIQQEWGDQLNAVKGCTSAGKAPPCLGTGAHQWPIRMLEIQI